MILDIGELWSKARAGDAYSMARCARRLDDRAPEMLDLLPSIFDEGQGAQRIGLTGNPGAGKSTLTNQLVRTYRQQGLRVAVIAVDPSSPFTGGAILGDRVRMQEHAGDPNVFIRSVATRGVLGGISHSTRDLIAMFDSLGFERIIVETVGVGQDEIDIAFTVDTNIVVCLPGTGDGVQMIKAGLLETADIFVLNKADHADASRALKQLERLVEWSGHETKDWAIPVCATVATEGRGVDGLVRAIDQHQAQVCRGEADVDRLALRRRRWVEEIVLSQLQTRSRQMLSTYQVDRDTNPYVVANRILRDLQQD